MHFLVFLDAFCILDEFFIAIHFSVEHWSNSHFNPHWSRCLCRFMGSIFRCFCNWFSSPASKNSGTSRNWLLDMVHCTVSHLQGKQRQPVWEVRRSQTEDYLRCQWMIFGHKFRLYKPLIIRFSTFLFKYYWKGKEGRVSKVMFLLLGHWSDFWSLAVCLLSLCYFFYLIPSVYCE